VSVDTAGNLPDSMCFGPKISADGRYVAFASAATNLVPGDTNGQVDVFVRDRSSGTTQRVSVSSAGAQADFGSTIPAISADGRYVVFESFATNLVPGDTNGLTDVFLRDRQTGITERISVTTFEAQANGASRTPAVSADGRYVVFMSSATNLGVGDTNGVDDIFLRDRGVGSTGRISVSTAGVGGNGASSHPTISADGQSVAFLTSASNLISWDTNGEVDVYYRAWSSNYNEIVSVTTASVLANDGSRTPVISADGRFVAFISTATNLVPGDHNQKDDVFVRIVRSARRSE
jgi:Tol biopolymer transport system component